MSSACPAGRFFGHRLAAQAAEVVGLFMKNWEDDDDSEYCSTRICWTPASPIWSAWNSNTSICRIQGPRLRRVPESAGRTPNPDVLCNAEIKLAFLDHAMALGAEHRHRPLRARARGAGAGGGSEFQLLKAWPRTRATAPPEPGAVVAHAVSLGEIRGAPHRARDRPAQRPRSDSTGICFIGERPFREFLNRYSPTEPGPTLTPEGQKAATKPVVHTLGQRKGLGVGGVKGKQREDGTADAWYVARRPGAQPALMVQGHDHPCCCRTACRRRTPAGPPAEARGYGAKTRYRQRRGLPAGGCRRRPLSLVFPQAQWAVTPGQSAVLYDGDICLGGVSLFLTVPQRPGGARLDATHRAGLVHDIKRERDVDVTMVICLLALGAAAGFAAVCSA